MQGIAAGDLDKRVRIETAERTDGALGGERETWRLLCTCWARFRPTGADERRAAAAEGSFQAALFAVRRNTQTASIRTTDRLTWGGWIWDITGATPLGDGFIELACVARTEEVIA